MLEEQKTFNSRYLGLSFEAAFKLRNQLVFYALSIPVTWDYPLKRGYADSASMPRHLLSIPVTWDYPLKRKRSHARRCTAFSGLSIPVTWDYPLKQASATEFHSPNKTFQFPLLGIIL